MTGLTALLTVFAVIAAGLLGGCSDRIIGTVGSDAETAVDTSHRASHQAPAPQAGAPTAPSRALTERLASAALDDANLSTIRGGFDAASGVTLNFAFQQATLVNNNVVQSVVIPTLTISPGAGSSATMAATAAQQGVGVGSLGSLGISGLSSATGISGVGSASVTANGAVQAQVSVSNSTLQALVNSGLATVVGPSGAGNTGVTTTVANTANNQLIQQMNTIDIGVSGLSKMMQQGFSPSVLNTMAGSNAFR